MELERLDASHGGTIISTSMLLHSTDLKNNGEGVNFLDQQFNFNHLGSNSLLTSFYERKKLEISEGSHH